MWLIISRITGINTIAAINPSFIVDISGISSLSFTVIGKSNKFPIGIFPSIIASAVNVLTMCMASQFPFGSLEKR